MTSFVSRNPVATESTLNGLEQPALVRRDRWGIPHVRAATLHDVFFLNGHVHAQDRMWQMEAAFRRATGRFAEWAGASALAADQLARRLGVEAASRRDFEALDDDTKAMLTAYAEGVNAWVDAGHGAPEYTLLNARPMRWQPWHSVAVMRQRGLLMGSIWFKLWRTAALATVGPEAVPLLRYDDGGTEPFVMPQGKAGDRLVADLELLRPSVEALSGIAPGDATVAGSNNWAVGGARTKSGMPLVAGDPHRAYEIPGMYAQLHLTCPEFDAIGFSVPGVPAFPHFCHTETVAWCVTHAFADIHDIYVEEFSEGGTRYRTAQGTVEATVRTERIAVRGGADCEIRVTETAHGPVIAGDPASGSALALKSVQLFDEDLSLNALLPMLRAPDLDAFYDTGRNWGIIDHSLVGADRSGRIGNLVRARVPERDRVNGWLPVPGWSGAHEWRGMIPFERMPRELDPERGFVVTANNRLVPDDHPDYLLTDCHPGTRAARVAQQIARRDELVAGDMQDILRDTDSAPAREIVTRLLQVTCPEGAEVLHLLAGWDGRMDPGLVAPTAYILVRQEMTRLLAQISGLSAVRDHAASEPAPGLSAEAQLWWTLPNLLRADDTTLLGGLTWDDLIRRAVAAVAQGPAPEPWGAAHRPILVHPLAHLFPDRPEAAAPDSRPVGGDGDCVLATGAFPAFGTRSVYGPVARYVFDLADWDNSRWIVLHGASGRPGDHHYQDQHPLWAQGELVPMPFTEAAVEAHAATRCRYVPGAGG